MSLSQPATRMLFLILAFLSAPMAAAETAIFHGGFEQLFSLEYSAGANGQLTGPQSQLVEQGQSGAAITAVADAGFHFVDWSDARTDNPRTDNNVQASLSVSARFATNAFGQGGSHVIAPPYVEASQGATLYYPADASATQPVPVVFFAPGWSSTDAADYDTILRFIASHGYAAVYAPDENLFTSANMLDDFRAMLADPAVAPLLDTSRIGVIGHSIGGGHVFNILDKLSDVDGWGNQGRFLFAIEPWFAFDMQQLDMRTLPANTHVILQQYGPGGFNPQNATDTRIPLTEFYLLESIAEAQKDYQVDETVNHNYPYGSGSNYAGKAIILAPLDALMELAFRNPASAVAHAAALELGSDDPYADGQGIQQVFPRNDPQIQYPCNGYNFTQYDIDYCDIKGYPWSAKLTPVATDNSTVQPPFPGSSLDQAFGQLVTRVTKRLDQNDAPTQNSNGNRIPRGNHHPYPKTQAWNSDMTMLRMNYRLYDANTLQELPITSGTNSLSDLYAINGALSEMKWSHLNPNVFFGVYLNGNSQGEFWQATIDRNTNSIDFNNGLLHQFSASGGGSYDRFTLGKYEGNIDFNDHYVVFAARKTGANFLTAIVYDLTTDTAVATDLPGILWTEPPQAQVFDWLSVSPLGNHILISSGDKIYQYDMGMNFVRQLANTAGHGDLGLAQNGDEVYVQFEFGNAAQRGIWLYRLNDGARMRLLPDKYNGGHLTCRNYQRPGWCYLSTNEEGYREVFALRINYANESLHVVNRFAQTHTANTPSNNSLGGVSPDGRRVIFFTDWGDASLSYYDRDTYQAQKPE